MVLNLQPIAIVMYGSTESGKLWVTCYEGPDLALDSLFSAIWVESAL